MFTNDSFEQPGPDLQVYLKDNFSYFLLKLYIDTLHLNCLDEMVQMMYIYFYTELTSHFKSSSNTPSYLEYCSLVINIFQAILFTIFRFL